MTRADHMMLNMAPKMKLAAGFALVLLICAVKEVYSNAKTLRKLKTSILCPKEHFCKDEKINFVYTKAEGVSDTIHYLYSTKGLPSVLVAQTDRYGKLVIDWKNLESDQPNKTIAFTGTVMDAYAILITKLIEYNDVNDTADLSDPDLNKGPSDLWNIHDLSSFQDKWVDTNETSNLTANEVVFTIDSSQMPNLFRNEQGSLRLKFKAYDADGRNSLVPHLAYTANMTQVDIALSNLTSNFNNSRFALEMVMVSNIVGLQVNSSSADLEVTRSIDDEHSPGVFETIDWTSGGTGQTKGGYMQWKPVCYTSSARSFADLNKAKHYKLQVIDNAQQTVTKATLAFAYFGNDLFDSDVSVSATNVSFGLSKDQFYQHTNYVVWSATIGLGVPPVDSISPMILLVISLGLGLPAILIIFGGIGISVKRYRENSSSFGVIN